jgi:hypothetical protein
LVDIFLLIFNGFKAEISVPSEETSLLFFPELFKFLNGLQYETALVVCEFAILAKSVQTYDIALLLGNIGFFLKSFPDFLFSFEYLTVAFGFLPHSLLLFLPFRASFLLFLTGFVQVLDVSNSFFEGLCR